MVVVLVILTNLAINFSAAASVTTVCCSRGSAATMSDSPAATADSSTGIKVSN